MRENKYQKNCIRTLFTHLCISTIGAQLTNENRQYILSQNYTYLQSLNIENSSSNTIFDVNLLVGLHFYCNCINGNRSHRRSIDIESKLVWILTGPLKSNSVYTYLSDTNILHTKPQYQTFDETRDPNFLSAIWDIESINMCKKD